MNIGGYTETKNATKEIQTICDQVKPQVEEKTGEKYEVFTALQYRSQLVNGTNYLIKVHVGGSSYLLLKVYQSFSGELGEPSVKKDHKDDPIVPF
uniref:leukocyte cysteine proteinase inhibitor 1-like n=1 Tax=Semicossyphus pulcher TaxID=241346 RepID=UPI0037E8F6B8